MLLGAMAAYAQDAAPGVPAGTEEVDPETLILNEGTSQETAGAPAGASGRAGTQQVISTWDFVRMLLILGAVVAVIYLIFRLLKKGSRGRYQETELIRLLDYRSLSGNRALHLVEVGRSLYLVGCAENAVTLVSEVVDKESLDIIRLAVSERPEPQKKGFAEILFSMFRTDNGNGVSMKETLSFMKSQRDRLKKLQ